ncbi:MAG: PAS domain S-box protein, partial [Prolixibacteraceae bacterium]|nr:PAS domain S-box protein [Prolixibacteraceae bacterium]
MKLLSRFIWLIIGISAIVFVGVTIFQIRTSNEFELIKKSIGEEYDVQVDKMMTPDIYGVGLASYISDICNDGSSSYFLKNETPDEFYIDLNIHNDILTYNQIDAVWFFNPDGSLYYFKSNSALEQTDFPIPNEAISAMFNSPEMEFFYGENQTGVTYFNGAAIYHSADEKSGYIVVASSMDKRWINKYTTSINNSVISIITIDNELPEIEDKTIRITRDLKAYNQEKIATLNIELNLPFLSLWNKTNTTDNWLMTGSIVIIVFFLIVFLIIWVISPLNKISGSLKKGNSKDIQPLIKGKTEMGDVARMIGDYHKKNDELEASESIKRHIIEQAQVGIIIAEADTNLIITTNPYACKLINAPEEAVINNVTGNFLAQLETENKDVDGIDSLLFNSKGEEIAILRTVTNMVMNGKAVVMDTFVDLSEIKNLQDKLAEEKKKLSLAVQNSGLIFCEYDLINDVLEINDAWKFLSKGDSKHTGSNIVNNIYESDSKKVTDKFESLNTGVKDTLVAEFRVKHPDRGLIWLSVSILITRRDEAHKPKQMIGLLEDITERIAVQQELIKAKEKAEES